MSLRNELLLAICLMCAGVSLLSGQQPDTVGQERVLRAAGERYRAGGLHRLFFGTEYRSLWAAPMSVPLLNLRTFGGGLKPVSKGGGQQTRSLLLLAEDGREFFFRSVDKDPSAALPPELRATVAGDVVRDQTSSALPAGPLVVGPLLDAAGVLHGTSRLYVLPDDATLGEFRAEFSGLMGFLEERVGGSRPVAAHWKSAREIITSDSLLARLSRSTADRVETSAFLTARLFDLLIGDWDRHAGQWSWARFKDDVPRRWLPIPQDRDQAFAKYDGILLSIARQSAPQLTNFGPDYPYMAGATWNGRDLDRRLLVGLEWPVWEATARRLQSALTDAVIDDAVKALPPEHYTLGGSSLRSALRSRRDHVLEAARDYYDLLARQVDVHATDAADRADLTRNADGTVELTLSAGSGADSAEPYFKRRFDNKTTNEVRLFLDGGNDRAVVRGGNKGPLLRVLGGDGQDKLVDSTDGGERFYDDPSGPARTDGVSTKVDRRPYTAPRKNPESVPDRDWGKRWTATTALSLGPDIGALIGGGRTLTVYGFRKQPFASRHRFRAAFATGPKSYRLDYRGEFRRENSTSYADLLVRASGIDVISFSGFGNEIAAPGNNEFYRVTQDAFGLHPSLILALGGRGSLRVGPVLKYVSTDRRPGRFLASLGSLYGTGNFGQVGGGLSLRYDSRDRAVLARKGLVLELGGSVYPPIWDVDSTFGEVHGEASTYLSARAPLNPTLAFRVGGRKLWGRYPFFEAAFIGSASTVRLGRVNRYAGDASVYGTTELRLSLARVKVILPATLGVFGLADAGRVFLAGESSDTWHAAGGGGVWLSFLEQAYTFSLAIAKSEERTGVYAQAGLGF
jgi:hypothetical protein